MIIQLSNHSILRAKERFNLNRSALLKICKRAMNKNDIENDVNNDKRFLITYGHFRLIFAKVNGFTVRLITLVDVDTRYAYKDKVSVPVYLKGKKTQKKMIIYN